MSPLAISDQVAVVLVEPRFPGNVGSVARAMANTGFTRLVLVKPCPTDVPEARQMALGALPILREAAVFERLEEALAGFQFVVGTTCRGGALRKGAYHPRGLAGLVLDQAPANRVAIVFGPEDRGLDNRELTLCQAVATIPSHPYFTSLNLSHAVMIILWEIWFLTRKGAGEERPQLVLADAAKVEEMYRHLEEVLLGIGYLHPENPQRMIRVIKRILSRAGLEERDVRIIRGMLSQFDWYFRKKNPSPPG